MTVRTQPDISLPFQPGDQCGEWRIVGLLGHGGAGAVYEAEHPWSGARVAIKALHRAQGDYAKRMQLEAKTLAEIHHRNVVRVFAGGVSDCSVVWFAMELLVGQPLSRLLTRERLQPARALRFAVEVAEGVNAAHELGVVHRDLKPENIFIVEPEDEVRVLDFGTAKFRRGSMKSTDRLRVIGTYAYMAPERLLGTDSGVPADIYSLGLVLYEMLAGRHCWAQSAGGYLPPVEELGVLQIEGTPEPLRQRAASVTRDLDRYVCRRLLHKRPSRRPQSMVEVAERLRAFAAECEPERPRTPRPARSRQTLSARAQAATATRAEHLTDRHPATEQRLLARISVLPTRELPSALATTEEGTPPTLDSAAPDPPAPTESVAVAPTRTAPTAARRTTAGAESAERVAPAEPAASPAPEPADSLESERLPVLSAELLARLAPAAKSPFTLNGLLLLGAVGYLSRRSPAADELSDCLKTLLAYEKRLEGLSGVLERLFKSVLAHDSCRRTSWPCWFCSPKER